MHYLLKMNHNLNKLKTQFIMFGLLLRRSSILVFLICCYAHSLLAQASNPLEIANKYLIENTKRLQLSEADVADYFVQNKVVSKHNKVTHLYLIQQYKGIPIHNAMINLNILENGEVLGVGNRFVKDAATRVNVETPQISMQEAVFALMEHFEIPKTRNELNLKEQVSEQEATFESSGLALAPIQVKLVYQKTSDRALRLAWNVSFYQLDAQHWWNARVDAISGKVLHHFDQVVHCEFGASHAICTAEHNHSHSNTKTIAEEYFLPPGDDNGYRVFPLFIESPNHGGRTLEVNPAEEVASPFGWHDVDGEEGAEFTITRGNNVHAYHDIFAINQSSNDEPDGGDSLCFDFPLDLSLNSPYTQLDAHTTNLFYWNNVMHDLWYQYGFDEESGNFQVNNYGRGGTEGDYVNAEALDGSGTGNANFATPPDGQNPRMQMFLWGGQLPQFEAVVIEGDPTVNGSYSFTPASFGGELPPSSDPIIEELVLVEDDTEPTSNACEPIVNGADLVGKVALIDRGDCQFGVKALAAENEGAVAVIVCNNVGGGTIAMGPGTDGNLVTIPAVMVSLDDCNTIKMGLENGITAQLSAADFIVPNPGPSGRGSDLDNGVIAHEYTHGISIRLTGGAGDSGCLTNQEQAGEGWSDWFGLVMTTDASNFAEEGRGIGTYALGQATTGGGIRTHPYSRDMEINPHTYADINSESVPHGVGSVFCVTIWDLYWNLVDVYGFDEDLYSGTGGNNIAMQLVMDGLKLQACNPSFIDSRDAILLADLLNNEGENQCLIWETFARRGIGFSAQAGGIEAFDLPDECNFTYRINKVGPSEANAGSIVTYEIEVVNGREEAVENAIVTDELPEGSTYVDGSSDCGASFSNGILTIDLGTMESGDARTCTYQVQLAAEPFSTLLFEDDVESGDDNWTFENPVGTLSWAISTDDFNNGEASFFASNPDFSTDQYLITPPVILDGMSPSLSFWHRYNTEANWDGGVVEISSNGTDWVDLGNLMVQNGYTGPVNENPDSPISTRDAFHGTSGTWLQTIVDLGSYAGTTVQIRFRFASDGLVGAEGWYVDDIRFFGQLHTVTNLACVESDGEPDCSRVITTIFGEPTNINEINQELGLALFPNPTTNSFTLQLTTPSNTEAELRVMSIDGRMLLQRQYDRFLSEKIDMTEFGAGVYLVQLRTEAGITTRKLIVE